MITLTDGVDSIILHSDYQWIDEHDWHLVEQSVERGLTGALIVQLGTRLAGRPITLQPEDDSASWMRYSTLAVLRAWANLPGKQFSATIRGVARQVIFRHQDGAIGATPVTHHGSDGAPLADDWYRVTLRLMEV